jgi:hypothetical protein
VTKAVKPVSGKVPVKRNRFITTLGQKSVDRALEVKARALAGWKGLHHPGRAKTDARDAFIIADAAHPVAHAATNRCR